MKTIISVILVSLTVGCSSRLSDKPKVFNSAEAGMEELGDAALKENYSRLNRIFGKDAVKLLSSGDAVADRNGLLHFSELFSEKSRAEIVDNKYATLLLGNEEWPFPIPLIKNDAGWYFDTDEGIVEITNRRIGRNELKAIQSALTYVAAQKTYAAFDRDGDKVKEYATKIISSPGKKDGLFWANQGGNDISPLAPALAKALAEGYEFAQEKNNRDAPYNGYIYRVLTAQGVKAKGGRMSYLDAKGNMTRGFALLAYPVEWGKSGVMSFIVNQEGKVFQQSLGPNTEMEASNMIEFNPDVSWFLVED